MRADTPTIVDAGGWAPKASAWARPTASASAMSVTYIRVRITSLGPAAERPQRVEGDREGGAGLRVRVRSRRRRPRHGHDAPEADGPAVAVAALPLAPRS